MKAFFKGLLPKTTKSKPIRVLVKKGTHTQVLIGKEGENLMDLTNRIVNSDSNIYGLCNKQLACTTCSIQVRAGYNKLLPPTDEQLDILLGLQHYRPNQTRMACQIQLTGEMHELVIEVPQAGGITYKK